MRNLFALLAAFFAGLWLNEQINRQRETKETERPIIINLQAPPAPEPPAPKEVDRRHIYEVIPEINEDWDKFDTRSSLMQHYSQIVRKASGMELTPLQAHDLGETLIGMTSTLSRWDKQQQLKIEGLDQ